MAGAGPAGRGAWEDLLLPGAVCGALRRAGFAAPAAVQAQALPAGRAGADLLVQARAGSGKTLAFAVLALERAARSTGRPHPRALVVAPTREVALQTAEVCARLAACLAAEQRERGEEGEGAPPLPGGAAGGAGAPPPRAPRVECAAFVGGVPPARDAERLRRAPCHVACGTPGRLRALLEGSGARLCVDFVQLLVLDEADRLLEGGFDADLAAVLRALPRRLQTASFSATYPPALRTRLRRLLRPGAQEVLLCEDGLRLPAVRHFFLDAGDPSRKAAALLRVLRSVAFHQALVFLNQPVSALALAEELSAAGFPAQCVAAAHGPRLRAQAMRAARDFRVRVLVATDLLARGVDLSRTNLVVNLDLPGGPHAGETLVHRLGRTGRFGVRGVAVSVVGGAAELARLRELLKWAERDCSGRGDGDREPSRGPSLEPEELPDRVPEAWSAGRPLEAGREQEAWEKLQKVERSTRGGRGEAGRGGGGGGGTAAAVAAVAAAAGGSSSAPLESSDAPLDACGDSHLAEWLWWDWRWRWHLALLAGRGGEAPPAAR